MKVSSYSPTSAPPEALSRTCIVQVFDAGCGIFVGGMLESGVGRASAVALAALPIFGIPSDLGPSHRYFERDVTAPIGLGASGGESETEVAGASIGWRMSF